MRSPLDDKLGIEVVDFDPDRLVATMPVAGNELVVQGGPNGGGMRRRLPP